MRVPMPAQSLEFVPCPPSPRHQIERLRHEVRRRTITVSGITDLSPRMRRFVFTAPDLSDFNSAGVDDHIKLFFDAENGEKLMRDFTPAPSTMPPRA
jgi:NADPH-dependent ferric siderophore reductase